MTPLPRRRHVVVVAAALAASGFATGTVAAPADAATVSASTRIQHDPGAPPKGIPPQDQPVSTLAITDTAGETNRLTISQASPYVISDTGSPLTAGTGCEQLDLWSVRCAAPGLQELSASLGGGDDVADFGRIASLEASGGEGDDHITGMGTIDGGPGADVLTGAARPEQWSHATLIGGGGSDTLTSGVISYAGESRPVVVDLADPAADGVAGEPDTLAVVWGVTGGAGDDTLRGTDATDRLQGGAGVDTIDGRGGDDVIATGAPSNVEPGAQAPGGRVERVDAGAGDDIVEGDRFPDALFGGPGEDQLYGRGGDDEVDGGEGDDTISDLVDGFDTLLGGPGDDEISGSRGLDRIMGGAGHDRLAGGEGGAGDDTLLLGRRLPGDCGAGTDRADVTGDGVRVPASCELAAPVDFAGVFTESRPRQLGARTAVMRFNKTCGALTAGPARTCRISVKLRSRGRTIGTRTVTLERATGVYTLQIPLSAAMRGRDDLTVDLRMSGRGAYDDDAQAAHATWVAAGRR